MHGRCIIHLAMQILYLDGKHNTLDNEILVKENAHCLLKCCRHLTGGLFCGVFT